MVVLYEWNDILVSSFKENRKYFSKMECIYICFLKLHNFRSEGKIYFILNFIFYN